MLVYRASKESVIHPEIHPYSRFMDYGLGFETTPSLKYAEELALERADRFFAPNYIKVYDFDEHRAHKELNVKKFLGDTSDWIEYVLAQRKGSYCGPEYDIVDGPAPMDEDYITFAYYESPVSSDFDYIIHKGLKAACRTSVITFKTKKSLSYLKYIKTISAQEYDKNGEEIKRKDKAKNTEPSMLLLEQITKGLIEYAAVKTGLPCRELIHKFYSSRLCWNLSNKDTKVWRFSYAALGEMLIQELNTGSFVYPDDDIVINLEQMLYIYALELFKEKERLCGREAIRIFEEYGLYEHIAHEYADYFSPPSLLYEDIKEYIESRKKETLQKEEKGKDK
jgi:hypothetical protein